MSTEVLPPRRIAPPSRIAPLRRIGVVALAATLAACQSNDTRDDSVPRAIDATMAEALASQPPPSEPPAEVTSALLPSISVRTAPIEPEADAQRFTINVKDAPAQQFFMSLVDDTPYNMVVHPEVQGTITLNLKNVSIPDVMGVVRDVYGYEFRHSSLGFEVLPARLRTSIFQINFLNMLRTGASQTRVSSGQVSQSGSLSSSDGESTTTETGRSGNVTGTEINTRQPETTFWTELATSIEAILGDLAGRTVVVNPQSGVVVVRAMPSELREVEEFLSTTQAIAARQVILDAKVLEVELNDNYRQGINWAAVFEPDDGQTATVGQIGGGSIVDNGASAIGGNTGDLNPLSFAPLIGTAVGAFGGMFTVALALNDFNAFIELLDTQGTVHVLSSPRIATMNNQKAVIKVGSDEFFVTNISSTTTTGTTTTTTPNVELTPFFSGIALDVTPQISRDGEVILHVHPSVSEVQDQQKTITVGAVTQTVPLAFSTVRESDSIVRAASGQVVVIGGLMRNRNVDGTSDTPLSGAPVVGDLFSHKRQSSLKSELVILLRPVVVEGGDHWASLLRDSAERFQGINAESAPRRGGRFF